MSIPPVAPVTTTEVFADLVDRTMRRLTAEDARALRHGDPEFLQRQLTLLERQQKSCTRPDCPDGCGCAVLEEIRRRVAAHIEARTPSLPGLELDDVAERYP